MQPFSRRTFLKSSAAAAATKAVPKSVQSAHGRKNVLFIAVDDLNHSLGCYGEPVHTPNLDRLAAQGTRFDAAYCQYPLCGPSRTSLLTGLAPDTTKILVNRPDFRADLPNVVTLPELFRKNGYYTARVGKIFHANNPMDEGRDGADDPQSWDHTYNDAGLDRTQQLDKLTSYTEKISTNIGGFIGAYESPSSDRQITDGVGADEVIHLLKKKANEPFFIAYGLYRPHLPWIVPKPYFDQYPLDTVHAEPLNPAELKQAPYVAYNSHLANRGMDDERCRMAKAAYYASVTYIDGQIGRVLAELKQLGLDRNTLVVFWGDHGWQMGQHGMWEKMTIFEWCARVPFLLAGPGIPNGKVIKSTTEHLDIFPTLVELCALENAPELQHGKSLTALLDGSASPTWDKPAVTQVRRGGTHKNGQDTPITDGYSLRTERYRYTQWIGHVHGEELYDYETDPREVKNLAKDTAFISLKAELRTRLESIVTSRKA